MKKICHFNALLLIVVSFSFLNCNPPTQYDLLIKNGIVYDGSIRPGRTVDIGILDDKIVFIGKVEQEQAAKIIDATGLAVAPGFIDTHVHLDPFDNLLKLADAESQIRQGVTTSIGGPDGRGAPLQYNMQAFLDTLESVGVGMNMGFMAGHNKIRKKVMGLKNSLANKEELARMVAMVDEAMDQGAFGLSTGLKYLPGNFADVDEVVALSKAAAQKGGAYSTHLRDEGLTIMEAIEETIEISKRADILVILTHHKVIGKPMWGKSEMTLSRVDEARNNKVKIMLDQYPYNASHTGLSVLIPPWARAGGQEEFIERTKDPILYKKIKEGIIFNILNDRGGEDLNRIQFSKVAWRPELEGKTLHDWLVLEGVTPNLENGADFVIKGQINGGAGCIYHAMDEKDVENIMQHPLTMIASDGRLSAPGIGHPHPRSYGTFPRVLGQYVREKQLLSLEEAIHKMTALPAKTYGIQNRGRIKENYIADLVIFDPSTVNDKATFVEPHQYPIGISYVILNGKLAVEAGNYKNAMAGKILRKNKQ